MQRRRKEKQKKGRLPLIKGVPSAQTKLRELTCRVPSGKCIMLEITLPKKEIDAREFRLDFFRIESAEEKSKDRLGSFLIGEQTLGDWMGGKFRIEAEFLDSMPDLGLLSANIPKNEVTISPTNIISSVLPKNPEEPWIINFEVLNNSKNQVSIKFLSDNCNITKDMPESRCRNLLGY